MFNKSFYDLAFGVDPGGARKDAHFIRATLNEVKDDLASELAEEINLYLPCSYGARLSLDVYQQGERTESIDLHPFVTLSIEGCPDITFAGPGEPLGYDFAADDEPDDAHRRSPPRQAVCGLPGRRIRRECTGPGGPAPDTQEFSLGCTALRHTRTSTVM